MLDRITAPGGLLTTMVRAGMIAPMRPDKYLRIMAAAQRENRSITSGFAMSAQRCPDRAALVDGLGTLTFRQIDERSDALAAALQALGAPQSGAHTIGIGEVGSIYVRNGSQFDGYTGGTTKDFHDGLMASGDAGHFDAAGRLFVVGRDDEMIVSGGENVYPIEVEKILTSHADVAEASVIGVDDEAYGRRLVAFVVPVSSATVSPDALKQHVREHLANYKVPRDITLLHELPRNNTGKVLRRELQERANGG